MLRSLLTAIGVVAAPCIWAALPGQVVRLRSTPTEELVAPDIRDAVDVAVVDSGRTFGAILRRGGVVAPFGSEFGGAPLPVPTDVRDFIKIDGGSPVAIGLRRDGTVVTWPDVVHNGISYQPPAGLTGMVDVGVGAFRCYAVRSDGSVVGWGQAGEVPAGLTNVQSLSIGKGGYNLALRRDGTVVDWVSPGWAPPLVFSPVPSGLTEVVAVSAGYQHGLALKRDGTVVGWGTEEAARVPTGLSGVVQVLATRGYSFALKKDGSVVTWGTGFGGAFALQEGFVAASRLAAGREDVMAIVGPRYLDTAQSITLPAGYDVTLGAASDGIAAAATVQWRRNGTVIPGATSATLSLVAAQPGASGLYEAQITQGGTTRTTAAGTLTITAGNGVENFLSNVSTRGRIAEGRPLIVGFVLARASSRELYLRGVGPGLAPFGVAGFATDPSLIVYQGSRTYAQNNDWVARSTPANMLVFEDYQLVGGFALAQGSKDAALRTTFLSDSYTAVVAPADGRSGIAVVECYDYTYATREMVASRGQNARVINLATRGDVGSGENALVAGFVLAGRGPQQVLLRGVGPALAAFAIADAAQSLRLQLYRGQDLLMENSGWDRNGAGAAVTAATGLAGAFALPAGSGDTALVAHLQPGAYTLNLSTTSGAVGTALVEVYEVDTGQPPGSPTDTTIGFSGPLRARPD